MASSFPMKPKRDYMPEDDNPEAVLEALQEQMNKCVGRANAVENLEKLISKAQIMEGMFNLHFRDEYGYTLLGNAVKLHSMEVIEYLVDKEQFIIREELIIAVQLDYKEAVDYLIKKDPELVNRAVLAGTVCRPGSSPVMIASLQENEQMLKFLFARGAQPLNIPKFNPRDTKNIIRFDAIYQTMVALSKPIYLCIMNEDPVMVSFKISERCEEIASSLDVAKKDLLAIKSNCEKFSADFIKHIPTFEDLQHIMNQMTVMDDHVVAPGEPWERLHYAISHNHMKFVANGSVQKLIKKKFFEGPFALQDFESAHILPKTLYLLAMVVLTPLWILFYLCVPVSDSPTGKLISGWMEMPLMRFMVQMVLYATLVIMVVSTSFNNTTIPMFELRDLGDHRICLEYVRDNNYDCLDNRIYSDQQRALYQNNTRAFQTFLRGKVFEMYERTLTNNTYVYAVDVYIIFWTIGNGYKEALTIWSDGFGSYTSDWVNDLNMLLNFCFMMSTICKYSYIISEGYSPPGLDNDDFAHPLHVADTFRALGLMFLIFKLFKTLRVTGLIGKPQYLLGEAFNASFKFFILFLCSLVAFSVSINGMIHSTYLEYWKNCVLDQGEKVSVSCNTRQYSLNMEEMKSYQDIYEVFTDFFFAMFQSNARFQYNFPYYENTQEWISAMLYTAYAFVMIVVRLNILISLIIFAVLEACKHEQENYQFRRAILYFTFIAGKDPLPPPFNVLPSINRISSYMKSRNTVKLQIFTDQQLKEVEIIRSQIKRLKGTYLREQKKQTIGATILASEVDELRNKTVGGCNEKIKSVQMTQKRTEELLSSETSKKKKAQSATDIDESINSNRFMQKYIRKPRANFGNVASKLGGSLFK